MSNSKAQNRQAKNKKSSSKSASSRSKQPASAARVFALQSLIRVADGMSLSNLSLTMTDKLTDSRDRALAQELIYGVLRWQIKLDALLSSLLTKKLKTKDQDIQWLLRLAVYELLACRTPDYAVISDAVNLTRLRRKHWASGMVNGVLRNFLREKQTRLDELNEIQQLSHPDWMIEKIQQDWPRHWQTVLQANNQRPPLWLRVNAQRSSGDEYAERCRQTASENGQEPILMQTHPFVSSALKLLSAVDVQALPGFAAGVVSVQDAGAQLSASLLAPEPGQKVLDLCAAPGGKTCHLLESYPQIEQMVAVELEANRMQRVEENLQRLQLQAKCLVADARVIGNHYPESYFDRILVDAPCSASGVIRRHPDIKLLRREDDLTSLTGLQFEILQAAWSVLKNGGRLLYVTCSVFRQENEQQIEHFLATHTDAAAESIHADWGHACSVGHQLLPGEDDSDGFYFCLLTKARSEQD